MALYVTAVDENSPAERFGLTVGCALLAIDGHPLNDALDYQFYTTPTSFSLEVCENEQHRTVQITKAEYEPLGCNFKTYLGDEKHSCANHCMFCFIDQLPPGMREPLYFKDDDERLSFLTNLTDHEIDRIIQMHISRSLSRSTRQTPHCGYGCWPTSAAARFSTICPDWRRAASS